MSASSGGTQSLRPRLTSVVRSAFAQPAPTVSSGLTGSGTWLAVIETWTSAGRFILRAKVGEGGSFTLVDRIRPKLEPGLKYAPEARTSCVVEIRTADSVELDATLHGDDLILGLANVQIDRSNLLIQAGTTVVACSALDKLVPTPTLSNLTRDRESK